MSETENNEQRESDTAPPRRIPHPETMAMLPYFDYDYGRLPSDLADISSQFYSLAYDITSQLGGPEVTVCLRKLLEAKDCAVRAARPFR